MNKICLKARFFLKYRKGESSKSLQFTYKADIIFKNKEIKNTETIKEREMLFDTAE